MCLNHLAMLACLLAGAAAQAETIPARIEHFLELCETSRRGAILQVEHQLRGLRNRASATRATSGQIARLEEQLRILRTNAKPVVPQLSFPPQVGAIGRLPGLNCHVDQVVSDNEILVRCYFPVVVRSVKNFAPRRETVVQPVRFLIRGLATQDIRVGRDQEMLDVFEVTGKGTYKTLDGRSKDVLVLTEFDMKAVEPYFRKLTERPR